MIYKNDFKEYEDLFMKLKNGHKLNRLYKPFKTKKSKWIFDAGTGKVFNVED